MSGCLPAGWGWVVLETQSHKGRGGYHIHHWRWRQSLKSLLGCLRLVVIGLVSSEFRAGISPFLKKNRPRGLVASLTFPVYRCSYRAASGGRNLCDLPVFVLTPGALISQDRTAQLTGCGLCQLQGVRLAALWTYGPASWPCEQRRNLE